MMKNKLPLVSIVTPSYNQGNYIRQTIDSVLEQDYPNIEYLVIDGGSSDSTLDVLREYGTQIQWLSEKDGGQAEAINKGWRMSHGQIITWLNSDDLLLPGAVRRAVDEFIQYPDAAVVFGELELVDEKLNFLQKLDLMDFKPERLLFGNVLGQPNVFLARWAIERHGFLNEQLHYVFDWEYWLRLGFLHPVRFVPQLFAQFRIHSECKTYSQHIHAAREWRQVLRCMVAKGRIPEKFSRYARRALGNAAASLGFSYLAEQNYRAAALAFGEAIWYAPLYLTDRGVRNTFLWAILGNRCSSWMRKKLGKEMQTNDIQDFRINMPRCNVEEYFVNKY